MSRQLSLILGAIAVLFVVGFAKYSAVADKAPEAMEATKTMGPKVYFIAPTSGDTLSSPVHVVFGLKGMGVAPAGTDKPGTGHHHLLIDRPPLSGEELKESLPADAHIKHFGGGQTETELDLPPGTHTLQLVLGDMNHVPFDPPVMSAVITIEVK